jgi:hypothetical protein
MAERDFPAPLIILSPPRSFSSVVSTMLGEHPEMYGFPELHLFLGDTVRQVIDLERKHKGGKSHAGPPGLLRSLAQLHDGVQTTGTAIRAAAWLLERADWSTKAMLEYLFQKVSPRVALEKSPPTAIRPQYLERVFAYFPDAFFLHLTRHPLSNRSSLIEFQSQRRARLGETEWQPRMDQLISWHSMHANILNFTATLPAGQTMRIRGEDVLSDPDRYLPQIVNWIGLRTDQQAIEAMKHPENSPYASPGAPPARGGNDPKFMRSPKLRPGKVKEPSLEDFFETKNDIRWLGGSFREAIEQSPLRVADERDIQEEISEMAALLGYF